jgi:hypothetical protein
VVNDRDPKRLFILALGGPTKAKEGEETVAALRTRQMNIG